MHHPGRVTTNFPDYFSHATAAALKWACPHNLKNKRKEFKWIGWIGRNPEHQVLKTLQSDPSPFLVVFQDIWISLLPKQRPKIYFSIATLHLSLAPLWYYVVSHIVVNFNCFGGQIGLASGEADVPRSVESERSWGQSPSGIVAGSWVIHLATLLRPSDRSLRRTVRPKNWKQQKYLQALKRSMRSCCSIKKPWSRRSIWSSARRAKCRVPYMMSEGAIRKRFLISGTRLYGPSTLLELSYNAFIWSSEHHNS